MGAGAAAADHVAMSKRTSPAAVRRLVLARPTEREGAGPRRLVLLDRSDYLLPAARRDPAAGVRAP
jgi:hypothetical protein